MGGQWHLFGRRTEETEAAGGRSGLPEAIEEGLIQRCQAGDRNAFEKVVLHYQSRLLPYLARLAGPDAAEDLVQETLLRAWRALPAFRRESSLDTWVFRIATNVARDWARRRKARPELLVAPVGADETDSQSGPDLDRLGQEAGETTDAAAGDPVESAHQQELRSVLQGALAQLSDIHRATLLLHDLYGFRYEEIAGITGCAVGTVKSRLFYARASTRRRLERVWQSERSVQQPSGQTGTAGERRADARTPDSTMATPRAQAVGGGRT